MRREEQLEQNQRASAFWSEQMDTSRNMTFGRQIAMCLMPHNWYYPKRDDGDDNDDEETKPATKNGTIDPDLAKPSLNRSWAYFEHVTLPRFEVMESSELPEMWTCSWFCSLFTCRDFKLEKAEPGDTGITNLYPVLLTPLGQMGDFGLGVGLYFTSLVFLIALTFLAGLLNLPTILYFASEEYSKGQTEIPIQNFPLIGSAICTDTSWVPCPNCTYDQWHRDLDRFANFSYTNHRFITTELIFTLKNNCDGARFLYGMINLGTLLIVILGVYLLNRYLKVMTVKFDEDEQTAADYSIKVNNPPSDAKDPEEWRSFFSQFDNAHVTVINVNLDNDLLVRSLVERREYLSQIKSMNKPGTPLDELSLARIAGDVESNRGYIGRFIALIFHPLGLMLDQAAIVHRLVVVNNKIRGLAQREYKATKIFVTFETEAAQRDALSCLTVGKWAVWRNKSSKLKKRSHLFRGKLVLDVEEADEPSTIRWENLNCTFSEKMKIEIVTNLITVASILAISFLILNMRDAGATTLSFTIAGFNVIFPNLAKGLCNLELHPDESSKASSVFLKIAFFRWINTVVFIQIVKPFTSTLSLSGGDLIPAIYSLFFADIITSNVLQLMDIMGHVNRHIKGPRAQTQHGMNKFFHGTEYNMAERYTNVTKIILLSFYYSVIYPGSFFLCSFALFVIYWADKFSIMRTWAPAPMLGDEISTVFRKFSVPILVLAYAVMASFLWTGFPFDNLCASDGVVEENYFGNFTIDPALGSDTNVTVNENSTFYHYCSQDYWGMEGAFPALPIFQGDDRWMTKEQEDLTTIYASASVVIMACIVFNLLFRLLKELIEYLRGDYEPSGKDMGLPFSEETSISAYIPQVRSPEFSYPLLACDISDIDEELFDWSDPFRKREYYSLVNDAEALLDGSIRTKESSTSIFDVVKHWPVNVVQHRMRDFVKKSTNDYLDATASDTDLSEPLLSTQRLLPAGSLRKQSSRNIWSLN